MKILLDIGTNAIETPLYLKVFILHLISEMPGYFKIFSKEWRGFCISTLVDYGTDLRLFNKDFRFLFKKVTRLMNEENGSRKAQIYDDVIYGNSLEEQAQDPQLR